MKDKHRSNESDVYIFHTLQAKRESEGKLKRNVPVYVYTRTCKKIIENCYKLQAFNFYLLFQ